MKKYLVFAASALALAGCQNDEFLGEVPGNVKDGATKEINFNHNLGTTTRAGVNKTGKDAADLLKKFYILGTKGSLPADALTSKKVFDNYVVQWVENSAGTTEDNTDDWKYVGVTQRADNDDISKQTIKYWDYSTDQYDFIAYSIGDNTLVTGENPTVSSGSVYGSLIATPTTTKPKSFSIQVADVNDLKECYITDVVTVKQSDYGKPVNLVFKNLSAKVRMAFYETVPGYTVSDIKFYSDATTNRGTIDNTTATLFASTDVLPTAGTIDVKYPEVGTGSKSKADYNKAFVDVNANSNDSKIYLGTINYSSNVLATTAKEASMAGELNDSYYTHVFPCPTGQALTLRVDYTLTSTDGSGETITVYGATAVIPATYTAWQPNYAYTYIFKISDNTNGFTSTSGDKSGLFPITFDAVVRAVDYVDFNQETITTVSAPSVTTYAFNNSTNKVIQAKGADNEYLAAATTDIYFSVSENGTPKTDLDSKGQLYSVSVNSGLTLANVTEAEVIDALQIQESTGTADVNGRNGISLTKETTNCLTASDKIPTEDGKGITVTANSVAKFTADTTPTTYAYVYLKNEGTPSYIYTAVQGDGSTTASEDEYYEDPNGTSAVSNGVTLVSGKTYYKKYTNNNNVYGVKVVRTYRTTSSGN